MGSDRGERVVSDWSWMLYDDHGPWDEQLGDPKPTHGWRRVLGMQLGPTELIVTEWHFGRFHPAEMLADDVREIHAVREPLRRVA